MGLIKDGTVGKISVVLSLFSLRGLLVGWRQGENPQRVACRWRLLWGGPRGGDYGLMHGRVQRHRPRVAIMALMGFV